MRFDDDNDDFNEEEFFNNGDEQGEDGDDWKLKPLRETGKVLIQLSEQILKTTEAIVATLPEVDEDSIPKTGELDDKTAHLLALQDYKGWMLGNARTIRVKISGAMATCDYILMSENATLIKLAARGLETETSGLEMFGYDNEEYLETLRNEIDEFRKAFVKWVRCFPKEDPLWPDGWGLFYTDEDVDKWNKLNPTEPREE
jgi:hypothetical protein